MFPGPGLELEYMAELDDVWVVQGTQDIGLFAKSS